METIIQLGIDFVKEYGVFTTVMFAMIFLMYRQQTQTNKVIASQTKLIESQDSENKQRDKHLTAMIDAFTVQVANTAQIPTAINNLQTQLISETQPLKQTMDNIMTTVIPIEQMLKDIREDIRQLRESVDTNFDESKQFFDENKQFRNDVLGKTHSMEARLLQVEKRATQEVPKVEPSEEITEAPTNITKLHSVSTKPKIETKEDES